MEVYTFRAIEKVRLKGECAERLFLRYPYNQYFERNFERLCRRNRIYKHNYAYQECYDACQLAYIYSIYRCSVSNKNIYDSYVAAYINKVMRIYFIAALVICDDGKNICAENDFKRISSDEYNV